MIIVLWHADILRSQVFKMVTDTNKEKNKQTIKLSTSMMRPHSLVVTTFVHEGVEQMACIVVSSNKHVESNFLSI